MLDFGQAQDDAQTLYEAGEGMLGTDESAFLSIFAMRHQYQLRATFAEYEKVFFMYTSCLSYSLYDMPRLAHRMSEGDTTFKFNLLEQGYIKERLKSPLKKIYDQYRDLIKQYEVPLSRMLNNIL